MLGLAPDEFKAYCLDEALAHLGNGVTNRIQSIDGKNADWQRKREFMTIMGASEEEKAGLFQAPKPTK